MARGHLLLNDKAMKKNSFILLICLLALSCGKSDLNETIIPTQQGELLRSEAEIRDIAMNSVTVKMAVLQILLMREALLSHSDMNVLHIRTIA